MLYIPFIIVIAIGAYVFINERIQAQSIKKNGVRVVGTIIKNNDGNNSSRLRLGGNINDPTIQFTTTDGKEIVGKPVIGFSSQFEVAVPSEIGIIYNSKNPYQFCINID